MTSLARDERATMERMTARRVRWNAICVRGTRKPSSEVRMVRDEGPDCGGSHIRPVRWERERRNAKVANAYPRWRTPSALGGGGGQPRTSQVMVQIVAFYSGAT